MTAIAQAQDDDAEWLRDKANLLEIGDPRSAPFANRMRSIATRLSVTTPDTTVLVEALMRIAATASEEASDRTRQMKLQAIALAARQALASTANPTVLEACATCDGKGVYDSYDGDGRAFEFECYTCHGTGRAALSSTANPHVERNTQL